MGRLREIRSASIAVLLIGLVGVALAVNLNPSVKNDHLVRMPGTQPAPEGNVALEGANRCLNCHADYNTAVEPGHNWKGSMMAQASRDFLFWACLAVAGQDSAWAIGTPNAIDLCERCHFPQGWTEGRSDPPNVSAMTGSDYDGVQCDFCHRMFDPFFETTMDGTREGNDWLGYWDETDLSATPSSQAADTTYLEDSQIATDFWMFAGRTAKNDPTLKFFQNNLPPTQYTENASGQFFLSPNSQKRASFADAQARHQMLYSRYHKSKYFCATCHDVSNPALANLNADPTKPLPTELNSASSYYHVERTFSEFMLSDYGQQDGAPGVGPFDPANFWTSNPGNFIAKCQDCHMRDVVGRGCDKKGAPIRPDQSDEHPSSGLPLHDLTGGNVWVSEVLASAIAGSPNYDATNEALLWQGPAKLTLDLSQGLGIDPVAMLDGANRAREQLRLAASIEGVNYNSATGQLSFRIRNQTGHKLISGFPEGRRMFVNVRAYVGGRLIHEINPYDSAAGTLKGISYSYQIDPLGAVTPPQPIDPAKEVHRDDLVYETKPTSSLTLEPKTFHFVLATGRYKDNRIPPKGFRIDQAKSRLCQPRWLNQDAPNYFTQEEYTGGHDDVSLTTATGADYVEINLYYQTTSREYIEFLRDEINGNPANITLPATAYILQTDPFFAGLKAWGDTIWRLWTHNLARDGATPFLMTQAYVGTPPPTCTAPVPTLDSATPASGQVTLTWSLPAGSGSVLGYRVYYDQSGKSQLLADVGTATTFADTGLTNGTKYCYKVTSYTANCESGFSNVLCATPNATGQLRAGATQLVAGTYVKIGKGKNATIEFQSASSFLAGDAIVVRATVVDVATGLAISNATVTYSVTGPEALTLTSAASDASGLAEATWETTAPNKKGLGGTATGTYKIEVTGVTASGYTWDGNAAFLEIQLG